MKMQSSQLIERFNPFFAEMFNDYFFNRYQFFFDRLISVNEISIACSKETDDFILQLATLLDNVSAATELFCSLNCDSMFDFYYRYHILAEYLHDVDNVDVTSKKDNLLFAELFLETWKLGTGTFKHRYF